MLQGIQRTPHSVFVLFHIHRSIVFCIPITFHPSFRVPSPAVFSASQFLPQHPQGLHDVFLHPVGRDAPLLGHLAVFLPVVVTLLHNAPGGIGHPLQTALHAPHPLLALPGRDGRILRSEGTEEGGVLLFHLSVAQIVYATVTGTSVKASYGRCFLQLFPILPGLFENIVDNVTASLFVSNKAESIIVQTGIIPPIKLFKMVCFHTLIFSGTYLLSVIHSPNTNVRQKGNEEIRAANVMDSGKNCKHFIPNRCSGNISQSLRNHSLK